MGKLGVNDKDPEEVSGIDADERLTQVLMEEVYSTPTLELVTKPKKWFRLQEGVSNHEWSKVYLQFKYRVRSLISDTFVNLLRIAVSSPKMVVRDQARYQ